MQERIALLTLHTTAVHGAQTGSRLEKLPRPVFTLNMTEAAWDFRVIKWESYIQQTPVTDNAKLLQLRAAYDEGIKSRVYDSGDFASLTTVTLLLAGHGDSSQECSPHEPLQDGPAAGGEHQSLQYSANWDSRDVWHVSEVQHMPGGHLLQGRGGPPDHHHRDAQP